MGYSLFFIFTFFQFLTDNSVLIIKTEVKKREGGGGGLLTALKFMLSFSV